MATLRPARLATVLWLITAMPCSAQTAPTASMEALLQRLVGQWHMTGSVRGRPATYVLDAKRVLQNRFVELHMIDVAEPPAYEARVFIGVDSARGQYIAHWLDRFGAAFSIPHATGIARGDTLTLAFPYAGGPFRDTFVHDTRTRSWYFRLEAADSTGTWRLFAEYQVRPRYLVSATPIEGLCVAVDPWTTSGVWWWQSLRSARDSLSALNSPCDERSTGPGIFEADQATVSRGSDSTVTVRFRVGQHFGATHREVHLLIEDGGMRGAASGRRVAIVRRLDLDVPPIDSSLDMRR